MQSCKRSVEGKRSVLGGSALIVLHFFVIELEDCFESLLTGGEKKPRPLSFVDPGGQFQAGIGCNISYVMCMDGGCNTSGGGGGGSGHGTETVTIRTFNVHIGINFGWVPVLRDPIGSIFGRGGSINDDRNGGIYSDVYFGGLPSVSFRLISNFFISITSNTVTRQIQTSDEEQSPASRPMGLVHKREQQ